MADIFLGFLLTHRSLEPVPEFVWLLVSSSCLYLSGMVFNDVFDRGVDALERPERPLPSGRVALPSAVSLGLALMGGGIAAAAMVGRQSLMIALLLAGCIFAYDAVLKRTVLSPLIMGTCRFLNVMLGASEIFFTWGRPQVLVALALGIYIVGVTWFARTEARVSRRSALAAALGVVDLGLAGLVVFVFYWSGQGATIASVMLLLIVTVTIHRRAIPALLDPVPGKVQPAIGTMLMSLVLLDASIVYFKTGVAAYALATAGLLIPSVVLRRWISVT